MCLSSEARSPPRPVQRVQAMRALQVVGWIGSLCSGTYIAISSCLSVPATKLLLFVHQTCLCFSPPCVFCFIFVTAFGIYSVKAMQDGLVV